MAVKKENIYVFCGYCGGDGTVTTTSPIPPYPTIQYQCPKCQGKGGHLWGWSEKEVL